MTNKMNHLEAFHQNWYEWDLVQFNIDKFDIKNRYFIETILQKS